MTVGRAFVIVMLIASVLWIPIVERGGINGQLFTYITGIGNVMTTPIFTVFVMAILWPRTTEQGAFWSLVICFFISIVRCILDFFYPTPKCIDSDIRPPFIQAIMIHYMYFSFLNFLVAIGIMVVISWFTNPILKNGLYRLTFWSRNSTKTRVPHSVIESDKNPDQYEPMESEQTEEISLSDTNKTGNEKMHLVDSSADKSEQNNSAINSSSSSSSHKEQNLAAGDESKWKRFFNWLLGVSTLEGEEIGLEDEDEDAWERKMQKKLDMSRSEMLTIGVNIIPLVAVHLFFLIWYG